MNIKQLSSDFQTLLLAAQMHLKRPTTSSGNTARFMGITDITEYGVEIQYQSHSCSCCPSEYDDTTMSWEWVVDVAGRADVIRAEEERVREAARLKRELSEKDQRDNRERQEREDFERLSRKFGATT